jgi:hypothetical protein
MVLINRTCRVKPVGFFRWPHDNPHVMLSGHDILAPSLPKIGKLAHHMNEIGGPTIIAEKGRFGYNI